MKTTTKELIHEIQFSRFWDHMQVDIFAGKLSLPDNPILDNPEAIISELQLNTLIFKHGDFTKRICPKSGKLLGQLSAIEVSKYLKIMQNNATGQQAITNEYKAIELMQRENIRNCVAYWIKTDPNSLEDLMKTDPYGFAVYCLSYIMASHSPLAEFMAIHKLKREPDPKHECFDDWQYASWQWALQKNHCREYLEATVSRQEIDRANLLFVRVMAISEAAHIDPWEDYQTILTYKSHQIETEILPACAHNFDYCVKCILAMFQTVCKHAFAQGWISPDQDYYEIYKLRAANARKTLGGYNNFLGMNNLRLKESASEKYRRLIVEGLEETGNHEFSERRKARDNAYLDAKRGTWKELKAGHILPNILTSKTNPFAKLVVQQTKEITS